jgi:hypothetical protein
MARHLKPGHYTPAWPEAWLKQYAASSSATYLDYYYCAPANAQAGTDPRLAGTSSGCECRVPTIRWAQFS